MHNNGVVIITSNIKEGVCGNMAEYKLNAKLGLKQQFCAPIADSISIPAWLSRQAYN